MSRCILENQNRQKMDIIKFVKCYDYFNKRIVKAVRDMDNVEIMDIDDGLKARWMSAVDNRYTEAVLSMSEFLELFKNEIGLDTKNTMQVRHFLNKYYDAVVPKTNEKPIASNLNNACDKLIDEKIKYLEMEKIAKVGLTKRYLATICSTVEEVYGKELDNPASKFDIRLPENKTKGCTVEKFIKEKKNMEKNLHKNDGK